MSAGCAAERGLDQLLDAFAGLERKNTDDVSLLLIGDGTDEARVRARCADEGLEGVVFEGFQTATRSPALCGRGRVRLSHLGGSLRNGCA
jgi:glycosyltransferase involved in cell wall biosynthesis